VVSRTRPAQGFGHDYPADRAWQALYGHGAYNNFPRHVRSLDVGFVRASGEMVSAADAVDYFQLVEKADGHLYWQDLDHLLNGTLETRDVARAQALARFLAGAHASKRDEPTLYARRIRELVGHGECVMGILDSYPHPFPVLPPAACEASKLRWCTGAGVCATTPPACAYGSFHRGTSCSTADQPPRPSRAVGRAADDVAALAINYLFFGMHRRRSLRAGRGEPFRGLFHDFLALCPDSGDYKYRSNAAAVLAFRSSWLTALVSRPPGTCSDLAHLAGSLTRLTR
jgi:hypothetical protein